MDVNGGIISHDTARVSVIRIYPDSFPNVSVIFKAETPSGKPVWNLTDTSITIVENNQPCKIISLEKVSKNTSINTSLVIDHSGSMSEDKPLRDWMENLPPSAFKNVTYTQRQYTNGEIDSDDPIVVRQAPPTPDWYHTPLWYAQRAAQDYIATINAAKDSVSIVAFSQEVDKVLPLTTNQNILSSTINNLSPQGGTALYDAIDRALDGLNKANGIKAVIVMTDGEDNTSHKSLASVITKAKKSGIPVFVIGLGDVNKKVLNKLANATGGVAYFTDKKEELSSIYQMISKRIQSVYEVVYLSPSLAYDDTSRGIKLQFEIDGKYLDSRNLDVLIPSEVMARLKQKEQAQLLAPPVSQDDSPNTLAYVSGGIILLLATTGVIVMKKRKQKTKDELIITNLFPNPSTGSFSITYQSNATSPLEVTITDTNGKTIFSQPINPGSGEVQFDLTGTFPGNYIVSLKGSTGTSSGKQLIIIS
ncbi:MAG: VWA domain-containing protein [Bacteroidia bacterium]